MSATLTLKDGETSLRTDTQRNRWLYTYTVKVYLLTSQSSIRRCKRKVVGIESRNKVQLWEDNSIQNFIVIFTSSRRSNGCYQYLVSTRSFGNVTTRWLYTLNKQWNCF